jgi:4-hydroxy-3-methylbut-2-enyl diphosphate reductase
VEIQEKLQQQNIDPYEFDTTCPFVEKVWRKGRQLSEKGYSLVIHGKHRHEETRATLSHTAQHSPAVVVLNPEEAQILADILLEKRPADDFDTYFGHKCTEGFDPFTDLQSFGVINQTTMLANETQEVMEILKGAASERFGEENFADTSDTLCYATNENQSATYALTEQDLDLALVVGGYNSSNTMHIVEILEHHFPTYHVRDVNEIDGARSIRHYDQWNDEVKQTEDWLPDHETPLKVAVTSGASCPDVLVDEVMLELLSFFDGTHQTEEVMAPFNKELEKQEA